VIDPHKVHPIGEWAVVLAEPRKKVVGGGLILTDELTNMERVEGGAGTVINVGTSEKFKTLDLVQGSRVLYRGFLKYANPIETDEKWSDGEKKHYFLIKLADIISVLGPEVDVGAYSTSPQERENASR
jgi:co-chaperonin GroES (HSP10)